MTTTEVFRPADGTPLLIRDNIADGLSAPTDQYRKEEMKRPQSVGGYRFGQLSHNSFFTRHNPHPFRVRHFKGLLDVPICSVNDDGYFASPRYSLNFPPNSFNNKKLETWKGRIPVNSINMNSQHHPINTITGLHYFTGLQNYPFRHKAIPRLGIVPVTESWRDELRAFTESLGIGNNAQSPVAQTAPVIPDEKVLERPRSTMYSPNTGRIIPPPSRAMSRSGTRSSRLGRQENFFPGGNMQHISAENELDGVVLTMICQILQTEDINAAKAWLCSSGEREKELVMNLVRTALEGREEYYKQYPVEFVEDTGRDKLPPIGHRASSSGEINRLVLQDVNEELQNWQKVEQKEPEIEIVNTENTDKGEIISDKTLLEETKDNQDLCEDTVSTEVAQNEMFKPTPPPGTKRALTPLQPARLTSATRLAKATSPEAKLKYTKSLNKNKQEPTWSQKDSINTF